MDAQELECNQVRHNSGLLKQWHECVCLNIHCFFRLAGFSQNKRICSNELMYMFKNKEFQKINNVEHLEKHAGSCGWNS